MKHCLAAAALAAVLSTHAVAQPQYNAAGEMLLPADYDQWVFIGSNLGLAYAGETATIRKTEISRANNGVFHNVYMETEAYLYFMENAEFRDPTQFIFELYTAGDKEDEGVLNAGVFNDGFIGAEMAVKDTNRPVFPDSQEVWAYYDFIGPDGVPPDAARAQADANCYACHIQHAGFDNVWVQFYPRLRTRLAN